MLLCICSIVDDRRCQNVVRTSVTYAPEAHMLYDVICDLSLNRDARQHGIAKLKGNGLCKKKSLAKIVCG